MQLTFYNAQETLTIKNFVVCYVTSAEVEKGCDSPILSFARRAGKMGHCKEPLLRQPGLWRPAAHILPPRLGYTATRPREPNRLFSGILSRCPLYWARCCAPQPTLLSNFR